jgi:plasmid replication initiation protein
MKNTLDIIKSNELIEARYKLSLNEQRLILLLISIIDPQDEDFQDYDLKVSDFTCMFGIENCKAMHSEVEQAAKELVGKRLEITKGKNTAVVCWLSYAEYQKGGGTITIRFDKSLKPYLLQLKSHFTRYQLSMVVKFKSQYSIRLYELLKEYEYLGRGGSFYKIIGMEELKGFFGIRKDEYKKIGNIKSRIIDPATKEISLYSDISITQVEYIREGRSVGSVKFTAEPKAQKPVAADESVASGVDKEKKPPEHVGALQGFGIAEAVAKKWGVKYGQKKILSVCGYVRAKQEAGEVKDAPAYLAKALENDYHLAWQAEHEQKAARRAAEAGRKAREDVEEARRHREAAEWIAATLLAFHALPEGQQEALRDRFEAENHSITMKIWKKRRTDDKRPENFAMFSAMFAAFFDGVQKNGGAAMPA